MRGDGTIAYKFVGPMTAEALDGEVKPQILKAAGPPRPPEVAAGSAAAARPGTYPLPRRFRRWADCGGGTCDRGATARIPPSIEEPDVEPVDRLRVISTSFDSDVLAVARRPAPRCIFMRELLLPIVTAFVVGVMLSPSRQGPGGAEGVPRVARRSPDRASDRAPDRPGRRRSSPPRSPISPASCRDRREAAYVSTARSPSGGACSRRSDSTPAGRRRRPSRAEHVLGPDDASASSPRRSPAFSISWSCCFCSSPGGPICAASSS